MHCHLRIPPVLPFLPAAGRGAVMDENTNPETDGFYFCPFCNDKGCPHCDPNYYDEVQP